MMDSPHSLLKGIEFGGFKARVEQARAQAASVAQSLQSLDEMAEDDEYIKSEGLNVKRKGDTIERKTQSKKNEESTMISRNKNLDRIEEPLEKTDQIYDSTVHSSSTQHTPSNNVSSKATDFCNSENAGQEGFQSVATKEIDLPTHQRNFYVHASVTALMQQADIENELPSVSEERAKVGEQKYGYNRVLCDNNERKPLKYLDSDEDYTSSDEDSDDEVMDAVVRSRNKEETYDPDRTITKRNPTSTRDDPDCPPVQGKKDPNRFFANLDAHLSSDYKSPVPSTTTPPASNLLDSFVKQGQSIDWLRNVVSPKIQRSIAKLVSDEPIGDDIDEFLLNKQNDRTSLDFNEDERINTLASSAISFGKDESMELERLEQKMKKSYMQATIDALFGNRYLVYIFLPFVLTSLAYFMTRKKTDDSVT